jgi:arginase
LVDQLKELGWQVEFGGHHQFEDIQAANDPPIGKLKRPRLVSKVAKAVAESVGTHTKMGYLPVTLGGDHSLVSYFTYFHDLWTYDPYRQWARYPVP